MGLIKSLISPYRGLPREIYIIFLSRFINCIGSFVQPLLVLILTQKIGFTAGQAGMYLTILSISTIPSLIIAGKLTDSLGRKKFILIFESLGAITIMICGLFKPSIVLAYMLILSSNFFTMAGPAHDALVADLTNPKNRKASYSLLYMGLNLGFAVGPIIGGMLYKSYLSLVFIGDGFTTLLAVILIGIFIKETKEKGKEIQIEDDRKLEKSEKGSVFSVLMKRPILIYYSVIMFFYSFAYSQWGFTLPIQMGNLFGILGAKNYGLLAGFNGFVVIVCTPLVEKWTHTIRPLKVIATGGVLYAVAFTAFAFLTKMPMFFIFIGVMTIGEIMISINGSTFLANHTPSSHRGRINSILPMISGAGWTLGPFLMGRFLMISTTAVGWCIVGSVTLAAAIFMFILNGYEKHTAKQ